MALDAYKMRIVAQGLKVLRQKVVALRLMNQDFSLEARSKNEVIIIPESSAQTVHNVSASAAHPALKQVNPGSHELRLDQWKESFFDATDKDETEANVGWFMRQTEEAAKALGNNMDKFAHRLIARYCPFGTGTAGTTPFVTANDELGEFFDANESLNNGLADDANRYVIVNTAAQTNLMKQSAFAAADERGSVVTGLTGQLGRKYGYDFFMSQNVLTIERAGGTTATVNGAVVKGARHITVDGAGSGGIDEGERLTNGGNTYHVVDGISGATGTITIDRPAVAAIGDNASLARTDDRVNNLVFHRDAATIAMRSPGPPSRGAGLSGNFSTHRDPESGLILQLEVQRLHAVTRYYFRTLYGGIVTRPELAYQIFG